MKNKPLVIAKMLNDNWRGIKTGENDADKVIRSLQTQVDRARKQGYAQVILSACVSELDFMLIGARPETAAETARRIKREAKQKKFEVKNKRLNAMDTLVEIIANAGLSYEDVQEAWREAEQQRDE